MAQRKEIAVIGGGLGGCLTALMLVKQGYHVTLVEAQDHLLTGASMIASRLHLGGEYPLSEQTAKDCLHGAVAWKLLMPDNIYTPAPPMKFLVASQTENYGQQDQADPNSLTVDKYLRCYEEIRQRYTEIFDKAKTMLFGGNEQQTEKALFGSPKEGKFFRKLSPDEYADYTQVAGGFQSQEIGLNVPKYLATIQQEIEKQEQLDNITVLTGHKVKNNGITGEMGNFGIRCDNGHTVKNISQIVQAAWQGGPAITPQLGVKGGRGKEVKVYKRAMLMVDLPEGWRTSPAFIMLGENGGMLAPYNDKTAICYLPTQDAAYIGQADLSCGKPHLPSNWDMIGPNRQLLVNRYFELVKQRFPVLKDATNPRLVIRDTMNFQHKVEDREHETVSETPKRNRKTNSEINTISNPSLAMVQAQEQQQKQVLDAWDRPEILETRQGVFTLYPTKATYTVNAAVEAALMVDKRSHNHSNTLINPSSSEDVLHTLLSPENMSKYSLKGMETPTPEFMEKFYAQHAELAPKMAIESWPAQAWSQRPDIRSRSNSTGISGP